MPFRPPPPKAPRLGLPGFKRPLGLPNLSAGYTRTILNTAGLVSFYQLDETSGTSFEDMRGGKTGVASVNGPSPSLQSIPGISGRAINFDGSNDYIAVPGAWCPNTDDWALEAWVKPASLTTSGVAMMNGGTYGFGIDGTAGHLFAFNPGSGNIDSGQAFSTVDWVHVVVTRDAGTIKFYFNGVQTPNTSAVAPTSPSTDSWIGIRQGVDLPWFGGIDAPAIYDRALSPATVLEHYRAGAPFPAGMSGIETWLKADSIAGLSNGDPVGTWEDASAANNDATQATSGNRPTYQTSQQNGLPVVRGDGADDFMNLTLPADSSRTIFLAGRQASNIADRTLFGGGVNARVSQFGGSWLWNSNDVGAGVFIGPGTPPQTTDFAIIALRVNSAGSMDGYVGSSAAQNFDPFDTVTTATAFTLLGQAGGASAWNGDLGELIVFDSALSDADFDAVRNYLIAKWIPVAAPVDGPALTLVSDTRAAADGAQLDLIWDLRAQVNSIALDLLWDLRAQADAIALDLLWDLRAQATSIALDLIWDLRAEVASIALDLIWDLRSQVSGPALDLLWELASEGVVPPPPAPQAGGGTGWREVPWKDVNGPPLRLRWGAVESPRGELADLTREPPAQPVPVSPLRARRRKPKPGIPVDGDVLRLSWAIRGAAVAQLQLRWAATPDAQEIHRLRRAAAESLAAVKRLASDLEDSRAGERAAAGRVEALSAEAARLRDDTEALEALLLSEH